MKASALPPLACNAVSAHARDVIRGQQTTTNMGIPDPHVRIQYTVDVLCGFTVIKMAYPFS